MSGLHVYNFELSCAETMISSASESFSCFIPVYFVSETELFAESETWSLYVEVYDGCPVLENVVPVLL